MPLHAPATSMARRLAAGTGVNLLDKALVAGAQLVSVPLLAHAWGLKTYGLWLLLATIPTFLAISDLGLATAAGTKMMIAEARGDRDEAVALFQSAWLGVIGSTTACACLAVAACLLAPDRLFAGDAGVAIADIRITLMLLSLYGLATVAGSLVFSGFKTAGRYAFGAFGNAMLIVVETGLSLALVLCGGSIVAAALGLLVGRLIGAGCQALWLARLAPWLPIGVRNARAGALRELIAPASAVMLIPIAQACLLQGTALALGAAAGQAAVPAFTTVRTLSRVGQQFGWALNAALLPEASKALGRRAEDTLALMAFGTLATSALLILPFAVAFALFGHAFIAGWTHGLISANGLTIGAMTASLVAGGFWNPLANLLVSVDRQATFAGPYLILALLTVPASYGLSLRFGAAGPALALAASDALMLALIGALTVRHLATLPALAEAGRRARCALAQVSQRPLRRRA